MMFRVSLAVLCICSVDCFAQETFDGSSPKTASTIRREETLRKELAALDTYLNSQGIRMTKEGIQEYLQQITDVNRDESEIKQLIAQLGAGSFSEREAAQEELMKLPSVPVDLLREASQSSNGEIAFRARSVLDSVSSQRTQKLEKTFRAIELMRLSGLTKEIVASVARFPAEQSVADAAIRIVPVVVTKNDLSFLSSKMTSEELPAVREIAIRALRSLLDVTLADSFENWSRSEEFTEEIRFESALALADLGDRRALESLLDFMVKAKSPSVRARSQVALQRLTGQRFDYYAYARTEDRIRASEPWKDWIAKNGKTARLYFRARANGSGVNNRLLLACAQRNKVVIFDEDMNEVWSYSCKLPYQAERMENGNVLILSQGSDRIVEVTPDKKVVREFPVDRPNSARPLNNGNVLITSQGSKEVREIDPRGKTVWKLSTATENAARDFRLYYFEDAIRLENGNTLVIESVLEPEFGHDYIVAEFDAAGKRVWERITKVKSVPFIQALDNGNVLISQRDNVIEVAKGTNKVVWRLDIDVSRGGALRLKNGNTLIRQYNGIVEVDASGNEIRKKSGVSYGSLRKFYFPERMISARDTVGHTLVALRESRGKDGGTVIEYDERMNEVWRYDCSFPGSVERMENGNLLICEDGNDRIIEVTPEKEIIREHRFEDPLTARPLANGNFLVTYKDTTTAAEIDPEGKIVREVKKAGDGWGRFWDAVPVENGNVLVTCQKDNWFVFEYDRDGKQVWEYDAGGSSVEAIHPLENGNVMITILSSYIIEVDKESSEIVWRHDCKGIRDAFRTRNGTTLVLTDSEISEVDADGKEIWSKDVKTVSGSIRR